MELSPTPENWIWIWPLCRSRLVPSTVHCGGSCGCDHGCLVDLLPHLGGVLVDRVGQTAGVGRAPRQVVFLSWHRFWKLMNWWCAGGDSSSDQVPSTQLYRTRQPSSRANRRLPLRAPPRDCSRVVNPCWCGQVVVSATGVGSTVSGSSLPGSARGGSVSRTVGSGGAAMRRRCPTSARSSTASAATSRRRRPCRWWLSARRLRVPGASWPR